MACTLLNQIFYDVNKFDNELHKMETYMLSQKYITNFTPKVKDVVVKEEVGDEKANYEVPKSQKRSHELFSPKENDKLFWGIYCLHLGMGEYMMLGTKHKNIELSEKQKLVDYVGKNKSLLKEYAQKCDLKLSNVKLQHIESSLLIDKKTSWYVFWVLCAFYQKNAIVVQEKVMMEFFIDSDYDTHLYERDEHGRISVGFAPMTKEDITKIRQEKWKFDPFRDSLLKGVSAYKVSELEDILSLFELTCEEEKPKKIDLYNTLLVKLDSLHLLQN